MKIPGILKPSKRKVIILIVLIILAFVGFKLNGGKKQTPLQFTSVKKQDIKSAVSSSGTLTGKDVANMKFQSSGKLLNLNVKAGDTIEKGGVIATLDTQDLSIKLQQAYNTLRDKQAIVDKALDDVKDHSKDETYVQRKDRTAAEVAKDNAFDSVKDAQRAFQDAVLIAPISGLVTQANGIPGQSVSSSDLIAQIADNSQVIFDTDIDESDIGKVAKGQKAEVALDAYENQIFEGEVDQILPQTKTTSSGATVVTVRIKLDKPPEIFVNGLSGQASIILESAKDVLIIPQEALREEENPNGSPGNSVVIQKNGVLESVEVNPGIKSDTDVEIKTGLTEGERVLLNPPASGTGLNQNRNPLQGVIFRVFGGGGRGGFNGRR